MDYEKKYKESMAKMSTFLAKHDGFTISKDGEMYKELSEIFPELKESEDERIRKALISVFSNREKYLIDQSFGDITVSEALAWLEKQGEPNPYSGVTFKYNGHTWGMCARDNGVEILIDGHIKDRVFTNDSNAKEMFIKALERVEEQNNKGYKLTDCDKNSWWQDFKAYTSCIIEQKPVWSEEVDLEKVFNDEYSKFSNDTDAMDYAFPIDLSDFKDFAKHFFELGMSVSNKAQKGE